MTDIGDVHGALYIIAVVAEKFLEYIRHDICAQIAYMREVIDCGAAGIHADGFSVMRDKFLYLLCKCIIELHGKIFPSSFCFCKEKQNAPAGIIADRGEKSRFHSAFVAHFPLTRETDAFLTHRLAGAAAGSDMRAQLSADDSALFR